MLLCANSMFGQKENALSLSLEEIKDMSQKIIKAYFRPVYISKGRFFWFVEGWGALYIFIKW